MICKNIAKYEPKDNKDIFDTLHELVSFIQFKNVKNTHRRVLFLRKLQASHYNLLKLLLLHGYFFMFLKIVQMASNRANRLICFEITFSNKTWVTFSIVHSLESVIVTESISNHNDTSKRNNCLNLICALNLH